MIIQGFLTKAYILFIFEQVFIRLFKFEQLQTLLYKIKIEKYKK